MKLHRLTLFALILAGCTAPGSLKETEPLSGKLTAYRHLTVSVTSNDKDLRESASAFSQRLAARIKKERAFPRVTQRIKKGIEGDLELNVELRWAKKLESDDSHYRAVADIVRSRDDRRLGRLEVPGDDYGVVTSSEPLSRALESMSNRLARFLKSRR